MPRHENWTTKTTLTHDRETSDSYQLGISVIASNFRLVNSRTSPQFLQNLHDHNTRTCSVIRDIIQWLSSLAQQSGYGCRLGNSPCFKSLAKFNFQTKSLNKIDHLFFVSGRTNSKNGPINVSLPYGHFIVAETITLYIYIKVQFSLQNNMINSYE